jgi:hypothetical protein
MTVNQVSVFVENKIGTMSTITKLLAENNINMRGMIVADTQDYGILRLIVSDTTRTVQVLKDHGIIAVLTPVLAVEIPDVPGGLAEVMTILAEGEVNVEYVYAFLADRGNRAHVVFRVEDNAVAEKVLEKGGVKTLSEEDLAAL